MKLLLIFAFSIVTIGAITGTSYLQMKRLVNEGRQLSSVGKYEEAQIKFIQARSQWFSYILKSENQQELNSNKKLEEKSKNSVVSVASTQPTPKIIKPTRTPPQSDKLEGQALKDSKCRNSASLGRIQFEDQMGNEVQQAVPELFSYDAAEQYASQTADQSISVQQWEKLLKPQGDLIIIRIKIEGQAFYYKLYQACLGE